jgi:uncharacterized protein YlzI (FlbEa/FlbD family)
LKYRPEYPEQPFSTLDVARDWVYDFANWYNKEHLHSAIKFITPEQRHQRRDKEILEHRKKVYQQAKSRTPNRWSGEIRDWEMIKEVYLNPENHKIESVEKIADRVVMLHNGKIIYSGTVTDLKTTDHEVVHQFVNAKAEGPIQPKPHKY